MALAGLRPRFRRNHNPLRRIAIPPQRPPLHASLNAGPENNTLRHVRKIPLHPRTKRNKTNGRRGSARSQLPQSNLLYRLTPRTINIQLRLQCLPSKHKPGLHNRRHRYHLPLRRTLSPPTRLQRRNSMFRPRYVHRSLVAGRLFSPRWLRWRSRLHAPLPLPARHLLPRDLPLRWPIQIPIRLLRTIPRRVAPRRFRAFRKGDGRTYDVGT